MRVTAEWIKGVERRLNVYGTAPGRHTRTLIRALRTAWEHVAYERSTHREYVNQCFENLGFLRQFREDGSAIFDGYDLRARCTEVKAMADRMGWTVEDNAKKAVQIADLAANVQRLREGWRKASDESRQRCEALAFARSCIKSGEPWTDTCEDIIGGALS